MHRQPPTESLVRRLEMVESLGAPSSGRAWSERAGSRGGSPSRSPTRNPSALSPSAAALGPGSFGDGGIPDRMPSADGLTSVRSAPRKVVRVHSNVYASVLLFGLCCATPSVLREVYVHCVHSSVQCSWMHAQSRHFS